jgi:hypothetical protein
MLGKVGKFLYAKDQGRGRISCLPVPSLPSGSEHRSEERMAGFWHLSGKEEQGFHFRYRVDEPEVVFLGMTSGFLTFRKE